MKKKTILSFFTGFFLILLIGSRFYFHISLVENVSSCMMYPFLQVYRYKVKPIGAVIARRKSKKELQRLLAKRESQLLQVLSENIVLKMAVDFEHETKELQRFKRRYKTNELICTQIIARTHNAQRHEWLIDVGSKDGVQKNMVAIFKNCLLGKITAVYPWYSKVTVLSDKTCNVAAFCLKTKATGIVHGAKQDSLQLDHVSHLATIIQNDLVVSAGKGLIFPRGFALGKIEAARKGNLCYDISVKPMLDFDSIEYCYLIKKS